MGVAVEVCASRLGDRVNYYWPLRILRVEIRGQDLNLRNHVRIRVDRGGCASSPGIEYVLSVLGNREVLAGLTVDGNTGQASRIVIHGKAIDAHYFAGI